jgi:two-component system cell cycle sensor histidine kinase/response regulator CckA
MDIRLSPTKNQRVNYLLRWSANIIAVFGILLTIFLCFFLFGRDLNHSFIAKRLHLAMPWIFLTLGFTISLLSGIAIRLAQVTKSRGHSLQRMSLKFQKELAERIKAEDSKQKLEIALMQSQKLQAIGTLAGGIAHDFNNLIYAIKGYVEMARDDVTKNTVIHNNLGKVLEATQRGQELISRILAFGRENKYFDFQPLHLKSVLESVLSLLKPTIPSSVEIALTGLSTDHMIIGDQTQLHQVIVNIINNAVDAMDGEGIINIGVCSINANDDFLLQFPNITDSNYCKINISDTGHGMDQTLMGRIYEPFFTTKEVGKGTGLGLSTVHTIMKAHKGEIAVTSQLGRGSTFTLLLPEYKLNMNQTEH